MGSRHLAAFAALGFVCCASALAFEIGCGGSSSDPVLAPLPDAGTSDSTTTADAETSEPYTLDNICSRINPKSCALRKPCCEKAYGYDEAHCLADVNAECAADVADVRAGRATFHPELVDACLAKYTEVFSTCEVTFELYAKVLKLFRECRVFEGTLAEGASCTRGSQCKPATGANEVATCDEDKTKLCTIVKVLGENEACELADGAKGICDEGLYCDITTFTPTLAGTCKKKTPVGGACNESKKNNLECGFGYRCDESGVCAAGKPAGAPCTDNLECFSVSCVPNSDAGVDAGSSCAKPGNVVKREECKGP